MRRIIAARHRFHKSHEAIRPKHTHTKGEAPNGLMNLHESQRSWLPYTSIVPASVTGMGTAEQGRRVFQRIEQRMTVQRIKVKRNRFRVIRDRR